jgi:hypothetical protein
MVTGELLTIVSDGDVILQRKLVSVENNMYYVCKEDEFDRAAMENREPTCIGFKREYILDLRPEA